jgi:hypothetical protein
MTCVAWDGKTIAVDKRATNCGSISTTTKLRRVGQEVLAWTGAQDSGLAVMEWYLAGANPATWPECQKDNDRWSRLIVASPVGIQEFERQPIGVWVEDKFAAWGSGGDAALGAMHAGATAKRAVEIASLIDNGCGNGVDSVTFEKKAKKK